MTCFFLNHLPIFIMVLPFSTKKIFIFSSLVAHLSYIFIMVFCFSIQKNFFIKCTKRPLNTDHSMFKGLPNHYSSVSDTYPVLKLPAELLIVNMVSKFTLFFVGHRLCRPKHPYLSVSPRQRYHPLPFQPGSFRRAVSAAQSSQPGPWHPHCRHTPLSPVP